MSDEKKAPQERPKALSRRSMLMDSQKAWVKRVVYDGLFNATDYRGAYEHHFGKLAL